MHLEGKTHMKVPPSSPLNLTKKVYLHSLSLRGVVITLALFAMLFAASVIVGLYGPTPNMKSAPVILPSISVSFFDPSLP